MASGLTITLIVFIVILVLLIIMLFLAWLWSMRSTFVRNNLIYLVQQGSSNTTTDIFDTNEYDVYIANKAPINITISASNSNKGRMIYISNPNPNPVYMSAGEGLIILQSSNVINPRSYSILIFLDQERASRLF
jgi:hypothetical protein